jgi:hypothetical protein
MEGSHGFDTSTTAYRLIRKLADLRKSNAAIADGTVRQRWMNHDVYIYERAFAGSVVLVAINKGEKLSSPISGLFTLLPPGAYKDYLDGMLGGSSSLKIKGYMRTGPESLFAARVRRAILRHLARVHVHGNERAGE